MIWRTKNEYMRNDTQVEPSLLAAPRLPTARDVARWRREHGPGAPPGATRRGDGAAYREIACRSALNRVRGMPFAWTLNPYRGCTHGCHFCFARRYQPQLEMDTGNEFSSVILVKVNFPDVLRRELASRPRPGERAAFGTATDPYQPIEGSYRLTRRALEALVERPMPVDLVTRGPLIVRDADLLAELSRKTACTVCFSVPTTDEAAWRRLEPGTAHPLQRLRALRTLAAAGVETGVLMAPVVPGISSARAKLEATVRAVADHGARFVGAGAAAPGRGDAQPLPGLPGRRVPRAAGWLPAPVCRQAPGRGLRRATAAAARRAAGALRPGAAARRTIRGGTPRAGRGAAGVAPAAPRPRALVAAHGAGRDRASRTRRGPVVCGSGGRSRRLPTFGLALPCRRRGPRTRWSPDDVKHSNQPAPPARESGRAPAGGGSGAGHAGSGEAHLVASVFPSWLLNAKVVAPAPPPGYVCRRTLVRRVETVLQRRLTVLQAPAGFGKTTVLADISQRIRARGHLVGWLALDEDDTPGAFGSYAAYAFERAGLDLAAVADPDEWSSGAVARQIGLLARAIEQHAAPCLLVLDEVERLPRHTVGLIDLLLKRAPPNLHFAAAFRSNPGLDLAAHVLDGSAIVVGAAAFRFSKHEIAEFFQGDLSRRKLAAVEKRTAGWPVALMVYRSAQVREAGQPDADAASLTSNFVGVRLLRDLSAEDRTFLLESCGLRLDRGGPGGRGAGIERCAPADSRVVVTGRAAGAQPR